MTGANNASNAAGTVAGSKFTSTSTAYSYSSRGWRRALLEGTS
jgi:hypothetical protein